ncbi:SDR family oxidoreductase [Mesohalobacter halotolerans]|uniref:SDR family oxidoreductase n=1 Tax=Mesohalobacter halotolerans TaxID=1883405 RepID=A0A4V6AMS3_9FLAO|nr:SDR family oxidoreductase [Mesohalobacter halotolerans]MBS3739497.1 SDR family oxidoreductase [Psychroflexus sp.]TKS57605.1 SDR family oxidoreductase [Mesohalobacter halotolerans]
MPKVVLVTGASSGLGQAIAEYLVKQNYTVYGTSRHPKSDEVNGVHFLSLDVTEPDSIKSCIDKIISKEKHLDILINNAGVGITGPMEEVPQNEAKAHFNTNFFGPLNLINTVLPFMRKDKQGLIINITSIAAHMGLPFRGMYSASKSALAKATEAYRMELKQFNIKMVNLAPGDFATNIASGRFHSPLQKDSPYYTNYKSSLELMDEDVDKGENPIKLAKKVHQIIQHSQPKVNYRSGAFLQCFSVTLKHILPQNLFEKILLKHYKL